MKNERLYHEAGIAIAAEIRKHQYPESPLGDFTVHEVFYSVQGDTVIRIDKSMYESSAKE
ncbi:MAG: hypothetical protein JST90_03125 [Bacteroidetes bacterium]|nr:hypothetical protein [Bacteroidota bacterium]